jgi:cyclin-dependent kinase regulatory subunit CKS1
MPHYPDEIEYSEKYNDDIYEYRHVLLPKNIYKQMPKGRLLTENEWRALGVQQSRGWAHYEIHRPEPHILLFRRPIGTDPNTGLVPNSVLQKIQLLQNKMEEQN